jgi:hypothetical protein
MSLPVCAAQITSIEQALAVLDAVVAVLEGAGLVCKQDLRHKKEKKEKGKREKKVKKEEEKLERRRRLRRLRTASWSDSSDDSR